VQLAARAWSEFCLLRLAAGVARCCSVLLLLQLIKLVRARIYHAKNRHYRERKMYDGWEII
jgi:hypothetical protein